MRWEKITKRTQTHGRLGLADRHRLRPGGCPSCVGPVGEVGARGKEAAARIVAALLAGSQWNASVSILTPDS
jgi:pantothenate kinase